jgi:beta-glucanase (GH16 family)
MKMIFIFLLMSFPVLAQSQQKAESNQQLKKTLVWSDEFDKNGLPDETKWNFEVGKARANNEPQYHTKELRNVRVEDGKLIITTRLDTVDGVKKYTSARINTRGKYEFTYGRVEVRAKLPQGRGMWPAIWTLGITGGWPACGEIDIMEYWGHDPNTIASNVHTRDYNHTKGTGRGGKITYEKPFADFHIYSLEWYKDRLDFYMDDKMIYSCKSKGEGIGEWPFFAPQYLILNQALWVNFNPGEPGIDDSIFPQQFIIDYVRVYEMK